MSRSRRRPYGSVTGTRSAKQDKRLANRGVRRSHTQALRQALDWDDFLLPHRYECPWNEVYSWSRDGKQRLHKPPLVNDYLYLCHCTSSASGWSSYSDAWDHWQHIQEYYRRLQRK